MTWSIMCDKGRESPIQYLETLSPHKLEIKQIDVGDYAICFNENIKIAIERKTWKDLADTIKDAKRKHNHKKLLDLRNECGCKIVYLIEGSPFVKKEKINRVPTKNLNAFLNHIRFRDDCHVMYSENIKHTAEVLIDLVTNLISIKNDIIPNTGGNDISNTNLLKIKKQSSIEELQEIVMCAMSGITQLSYASISAKFKITDIINGLPTIMDISELKYKSGNKFGNKRAKIILNQKYTDYIRMLSAIPGVTKETARKILEAFPMKKLISSDVSADDIANVVKKKTFNKNNEEKIQRVGPSIGNKIIQVFS